MDLEEIVMKMKSANRGPSEEDFCTVMLRSLPTNYEILVQAFRVEIYRFKFSDLVSKLISEEVLQGESVQTEDSIDLYTNKKAVK